MITKSRFSMMAVTVLMVFVLSAVWTVPAFADDSTPPPVEPTVEVPPPIDEPVVADTPAVEVVAPADAAPADAVPTEVAPADASPADATITEVLAQAPEGTTLQVVDENGETLALATQEAADVVALGDPIWCPVGVVPKASIGGCSPSFTSFTNDATPTDAGLINWLNTTSAAAVSKAGVIWVAYNYNSGVETGPIIIDGLSVAGTMENFALTIKGGWSGLAGSTVINQNAPSEFNGVSLSIINWMANVSLSDITISGATSNTLSDDNALLIKTNASAATTNIQLDRVTVKDSINGDAGAMTGATLDNSSSTKASTVIVNNGIFENNEGDGLRIFSAGVVTITSLIADGNDVGGARIDNTSAIADKAVTLKGVQEYNYNGNGAGLVVLSDGLITISNVVANGNAGNGVDLDNTSSLTNQGVTIGGTNNFVDNSIGLNVLSHGVISANNINASDNGDAGAVLDNCDGAGDCAVPAAKLVKLTGYNNFFNNQNDGLQIVSFGAITVSNLTASDNGGNGAYLDNQWSSSITTKESSGGITQTGYGVFNNNSAEGLLLFSHYHIALTNLAANGNGFNGLTILADRLTSVVINKVTVSAVNVTVTGLNNFIQNGDDGLLISADGKITLAAITANFNGDDGADLKTTTAGSAVTLTGANNFTQNTGAGLYVDSAGAISASHVAATYNQYGAQLFNNKNTAKQYNVTLSGTNSFNFNNADGLDVHSYGIITVNNLTANANGLAASSGNGATLDSCNAPDYTIGAPVCVTTTAKTVTLTGYVNVSDNYFRGLQIYNLGAVTLSNAFANGNGNVGVHINNQLKPTISASVVRTVTIKGSNTFNYNGSSGLFIRSFGAITLTNINAYGNIGLAGAALINDVVGSTYAVKNITITGVNSFIRNDQYGLFFSSGGAVSLTRINADGNDWDVADGLIGGGLVGTAKTITLTCGHMFGNGFSEHTPGYNLAATGALTIKGIYSANNGALDTATGVPTPVITRACALP